MVTTGQVKSLIRLGSGLQPLLTGRENIYAKCAELGIGQREARRRLDDIVSFGGLEKVLDTPVKRYSDGLYARLEFAIVTAVPLDILLLDEVLAVCDLAFQVRCLERLQQLKRAGTTILFVSHSEPNIRHVADRCLLLFEGQALAYGEPRPCSASTTKRWDSATRAGRRGPRQRPHRRKPPLGLRTWKWPERLRENCRGATPANPWS